MQNFSWTFFALTGDVDAYLLYCDAGRLMQPLVAEQDGLQEASEQLPEAEAVN